MEYISGSIMADNGFTKGYIGIENGIICEIEDGIPPSEPFAKGLIMPGIVNAHTHCADGNIQIPNGISLEDLVAPPNGLKHRYLSETSDEELADSIGSFADAAFSFGTTGFIDFRETGVNGSAILRNKKTIPNKMILGRPSSKYDSNEMDELLDIADGVGISSISDIGKRELEKMVDHAARRKKIFAIHVSERIREDIGYVLSLEPEFVVHMTKAALSDMKKCADADIPIVSCPTSNMFFGSIPPVKDMIDSGAPLMIGTDNAMLCPPDILNEINKFIDLAGNKPKDKYRLFAHLVEENRKSLYGCGSMEISIGKMADLTVILSHGCDTRILTDRCDRSVVTIFNNNRSVKI